MKKAILFFVLIQFSFISYCQWDVSKLELPSGGNNFVELKPLTGVIYLKDAKINEWWIKDLDASKPSPNYFGIVQFATDRLNIFIYKSNGEHVTSFFLNDVEFKKEKRDWSSDSQIFTLQSKSKNVSGKITIRAPKYVSGYSVEVQYNVKDSKGEDEVALLLTYDKN